MNRILMLLLFTITLSSYSQETSKNKKSQFNQEILNELEQLFKIDQIAAGVQKGSYKKLSEKEWNSFKDSVFNSNQKRIEILFNQYGFLGYDLVGERGSSIFWTLVQHLDHTPAFQKRVLAKMKIEVLNGNAKPSDYGYLVDRVQINTGKQQVYGTQVDYNWKKCQAYPINLKDSIHVNNRRNQIGLAPLEVYLNEMSQFHFELNKETFLNLGITEPTLYTIKN